jgi:hypothetical protein
MHVDISAENDTIARIGTSCFQKLVESNVDKLSSLQWQLVTSAFVKLFKVTTPHQLFDESLRVEISSSSSTPDTPGTLFNLLCTSWMLNCLISGSLIGIATRAADCRSSRIDRFY